jgi:hypothetical protein
MLIISHRGNIEGPDAGLDNNPKHIKQLLDIGMHVEVDVWLIVDDLYLGHDAPTYKITLDYLKHSNLWCHAKNLEALVQLLENKVHCFWHENDDFTLTSNNIIWTYPGKLTTNKSVIVDTSDNWRNKEYQSFGVCVDYVN